MTVLQEQATEKKQKIDRFTENKRKRKESQKNETERFNSKKKKRTKDKVKVMRRREKRCMKESNKRIVQKEKVIENMSLRVRKK